MICRCREREIMYNHCQFETGKPQGFWSVSKDSCICQSRSAYCAYSFVFVMYISDRLTHQMARVSTWAGQLPLRLLDHGRLITDFQRFNGQKESWWRSRFCRENVQNSSSSAYRAHDGSFSVESKTMVFFPHDTWNSLAIGWEFPPYQFAIASIDIHSPTKVQHIQHAVHGSFSWNPIRTACAVQRILSNLESDDPWHTETGCIVSSYWASCFSHGFCKCSHDEGIGFWKCFRRKDCNFGRDNICMIPSCHKNSFFCTRLLPVWICVLSKACESFDMSCNVMWTLWIPTLWIPIQQCKAGREKKNWLINLLYVRQAQVWQHVATMVWEAVR